MSGIATPQEINVDHDGQYVVVHISGAGTMKMPPTVAHWLSRQLIAQVNAIDKLRPGERWPHLQTKG